MHSRVSSTAKISFSHFHHHRPSDQSKSQQIFIGGLAASVTEKDLTAFLTSTFGCLRECRLLRYRDGSSRGFTFVTFVSPHGHRALLAAVDLSIHGKSIECKPALDQEQSRLYNKKTLSRKIYVGNLPVSTTSEEVFSYFSSLSNVEGVQLIQDKNSKLLRGFGFVTFKSPLDISLMQSQKSSLPLFNGHELEIRPAFSKGSHYELTSQLPTAMSSARTIESKKLGAQKCSCISHREIEEKKPDISSSKPNYRFNRRATPGYAKYWLESVQMNVNQLQL